MKATIPPLPLQKIQSDKYPEYKTNYPLYDSSTVQEVHAKSLNQEWSEHIKNLDYNEVVDTRPRSKSLKASSSNDQVDVLEFFKNNSYTDCIYAEEICNLLQEYSLSSTMTQKSRILDRLDLIRKHLE